MNTLTALVGIVIMVLQWIVWALILQAILSWLVAFNVVNMSNGFVRGVYRGLDRFFTPLLSPIRRVLPELGGIDLSPMVLILLIFLTQKLLESIPRDLGLI